MVTNLKVIVAVLFIVMLVGCGNTQDSEKSKDIVAESGQKSDNTMKEKDGKQDFTENDGTEKEELMDNYTLDMAAGEVMSVVIKDGTTGMEVKKISETEELEAFFQVAEKIQFEKVKAEDTTGWKYMLTISRNGKSDIVITVTSDEWILISTGGKEARYKTEYKLTEYIESVIVQ